METSIKISQDTKKRLLQSKLAEKGKTFDMIVNELLNYHANNEKTYKKDYKEWKELQETNKKAHEQYLKEKTTWDKLLIWAKKQGFKP